MKRLGRALLLLLLLAVNISLFWLLREEYENGRRRNTRYSESRIYASPLDSLAIFGSDKYGSDILIGTIPEYQNSTGSKEILLFSPFQRTYTGISFYLHLKVPRNRYYFQPGDVNGDGRVEIPLYWIEDRQVHIELRDFAGKIVAARQLEPLSLPLPSDNVSCSFNAIADIDLDGRVETVMAVSSEFFGLPRGIAVHDLESGRRKWEYLTGAIPLQMKTGDINGDGKQEIVFSAWAPHNGYSCNGTNDDTSYVGVLDCAGRLLWRNEAGGFYSEIFFATADLDRDGKMEIVTARACHRQVDPDRGEIKVLRADRRDGSAGHLQVPDLLFPAVHPRYPGRPRPGDRQRRLHGRADHTGTKSCEALKRVNVGEPVKVLGLHPVGMTEAPLIVARVGAGGSRLYDGSLNLVHRNPEKLDANIGLSVLPIRQGKSRLLLLGIDQLYLISLNPHSRNFLAAALFSRSALVLAWILAFNALFFFWRRERSKKRAAAAPGGKEDSGWLTVTQEMVHRMKTPMTNILWEAEQLKTGLASVADPAALPEAVKKTPDSLIGELKELKLMNRYLMKFLQIQSPKFKTADLNSLLREVAEKYARHLKGRIAFTLDLDEGIPRLAVDEEQLGEVFVNIVENAIDAMPDGGALAIGSRWRPKEAKGAEIVFADTGKGIPAEQLNMIFTPNYTTKEEGFGIGLPVCQRIVAAHGGSIAVESRVGIGTKIAIFIPWKHPGAQDDE